ncbi:PREDICTED: uncharacterized protein LOC108552551 [Eufriesea mexicana]|uniref:uncharacterized protein LOC108552551 n=1 Tax=Eufriesea mexicana TaxID=516756 RepID=UPI00083C85E3|nr:PREDICTED: uncharacterized protein LOC108552551 [Eufriesea mexicana]
MSPSIRSPTILLFLLLYANNTICWNILETSEILDQLQDIDLSRNRRNSEDESPIWMEYEFGTGVGNREDLVVSNISVHRYPKLPETATDWQFLDVNGTNYLFRTEKSTLFFYKFDSEKPAVDDPVNLHVDGAILTFKVISLRSEFDIVAVLCVESANGTLLRWYKLVDGNSFEFFWSWPIQKRIKDITFIQHEEPYKILLLNDNDMHIGPQYSFIDVYGFNIELATDTFHFWLHHRSFVPSALDIQVCSVYENILLAVQTANDVLLYEYRNTMETNIFQNVQTIKSQDLQNFVCFESGYLQFLAISGPEAGLFHSVNGEFQFNTDSEFDVSEITWVGSIRLDTYRDESLLLIQLKNSTVSALAWQGLSFKKIQLPNNILDRFDLSKITPLPKYGFIFGNRFVKLHTELKSVKHPIQYTTERLLILQRLLNDTLNHQEKILDETEARLNKSYLVNPVVTGFWNLSIVNATNATISDNVIYQSVTLGATNLTNEDLAFDTNKFEDKLKSVQEKLDKIDAKLTSVVDSNSGELRLDSDVEIFGNINVTGNLYVRNLTALSINDFNITTDSDSSGEYHVIGGNKKLDSIQAENLTVHTVNGIPIENIRFGDVMEDYSHVDFSRINRAEIDGHLSFSTINGIDWKTLMKNIVWKDKSMFIPGDTVIEGTLSSDIFKLVIVNDLFYPEDYVLMSSTTPVIVTGRKSFDFVLTTELGNVTTLNGVDFQDYVILNKENVLKKEMTFENLTIDGELRIDGDVTGLNMTENKLLNETCNISSDIMFLNLNVLGNVTYDTLFMNKRPLNLGDLLLRTDKEVEITGTKTFLNNVAMKSNVTITSGMVNGHLLDEFATTDTDQVFPNLIEILPNVTFGNVTFGATKKLEDFLKQNTNSSGCLDKAVVFKSPITVDELFFDTLNGNISYEVFNERVNETFRNVSLENLIAETVFADEITSKVINGLDFDDFVKNATSANIIDEYITDRLEADRLNVSFINGMSIDEIKMLQDKLDDILHNIRNGNVTLDSLQVTGMITTNLLNGKVFTDLYNEDEIDTVIFKEDVSIQNLTILGLLNGFNFTELVLDTVLKTDTNITIDGFKVFDRINCDELHTSFLNGRPIENLLDPFKDQVLTGPVVVNGTVTVLKEFNTSGNIGDVPFYDLMNRFKSLGNNTYELHGNVRFPENTTIENLHIDGLIYGRNFDSFLNSVVFINEDNVTISGTKVFKNSITFNDEFTVRDKLNDVDLKRFQEKAIFINKPFSVKSKIIFKNGIKVKKNVQVGTKFETKSIMGIDVNDLKYNILYLNRPNHIEVPLTFTNVIFESNVQVEKFNDLDMKLLIPLHTDQMIPVPALNCRNVTVEKLQILGRVNEQNLQEIQDTTFMMTGDQDITGHFNFRGKVHIHHDFNPRFINGIDTTTFIPLNSRSPIVGNFVFESPVYFNKSLRVLSYLNGIDPSRWKAVAVTSNDPLQQFISGKWTVFGNVYFKKGSSGSDILNGINVTDVSNTLAKRHLEMDAILDEKNENLDSVCEDLTELKRYAEKQIYQFNAFDYLQSIKFDNILVSAYHFELDDLDYLLLSYNTCQLHTFLFTGTKFELIGNVSDFGVVEQWTTFRHYQVLYFLTSGRSSCGRSPVNLWMLKNNEFQHVLDLGHNIDSRKVNQDVFLMLINNREQLRSSGRIIEELEKSLSPVADDDDMQIVLQTDQMLLSSKHGIYEYNINRSSNSSLRKSSRKPEILNFEAGFLQKEMFLYYDKEVSKNRIFIGNNDGNQKKILQTIKAHRPTSFVILNFDGAIETLLVFIENKRKLRIYEYKGIQGFVYKDIIKMNVDNLFSFKIRKYPNMAKRYCLALFRENKLTILEALMYGEKLDMGPLTC